MTPKRYTSRRFAAAAMMSAALVSGLSFAPAFTPIAMAQEAAIRTLTVTGQGEESVPTTKTQVELGVDVQGTDAAAVQREVAQRTSAVVELLRSRQVEKLETTGIQLSPRYNYDNGRSDVIGYSGSNTVSFRMPTESVGSLIDDAVNAGANQIRGVSFVADDDALETARQRALRAAVEDAQAQAGAVLGSLNLRSQEIIGIQINGAAPPMPVPMLRRAEYAAGADASTPVVGGDQTVQAQVTLQIRY
ncbi:SIMPL domain-containing protein [Nodosilinea nodulosa]|uniref:SIMPL domain-containing protein n=1 Tax=Nodosilinea nodulosa TaxID=416001 RepID=UPI00030B390E|nr:SIMPL domain-containing protein [Nodosilinea nodulosa]